MKKQWKIIQVYELRITLCFSIIASSSFILSFCLLLMLICLALHSHLDAAAVEPRFNVIQYNP